MSEVKLCPECNTKKSLDEFYKIPYSGNPEQYCKSCKSKLSKQYKRPPKNESGNQNEQRIISLLRGLGIYAVTGKASEFKRTDIVAWGCVRIELKSSSINKTGYYHYGFTPNQRKGALQADLIFVDTMGDYPVAVFLTSHPVFYKPSGRLKQAFAWEPRMRKTKSKMGTVVLSSTLMREYAERWELIESVRQQRIKEMQETGGIVIEEVSVRSPQLELPLE